MSSPLQIITHILDYICGVSFYDKIQLLCLNIKFLLIISFKSILIHLLQVLQQLLVLRKAQDLFFRMISETHT